LAANVNLSVVPVKYPLQPEPNGLTVPCVIEPAGVETMLVLLLSLNALLVAGTLVCKVNNTVLVIAVSGPVAE
jgi:hypothetical protein